MHWMSVVMSITPRQQSPSLMGVLAVVAVTSSTTRPPMAAPISGGGRRKTTTCTIESVSYKIKCLYVFTTQARCSHTPKQKPRYVQTSSPERGRACPRRSRAREPTSTQSNGLAWQHWRTCPHSTRSHSHASISVYERSHAQRQMRTSPNPTHSRLREPRSTPPDVPHQQPRHTYYDPMDSRSRAPTSALRNGPLQLPRTYARPTRSRFREPISAAPCVRFQQQDGTPPGSKRTHWHAPISAFPSDHHERNKRKRTNPTGSQRRVDTAAF